MALHETRGQVWHQVWHDREEERADWNGYESCFATLADYERWTTKVATILRERLALGSEDTVIDLGCGTGRVAALLAPYVKQVIALDYSKTVLALARRRRSAANISYGWA